jgi:DNA-binding SARP family transcriptional activator
VGDLRIEVLGRFRVELDGRPVDDAVWRRRKPAAVVKLLALTAGRRLHREQLEDLLWPDLDPPAAAANLRKALHLARRGLGEVGATDILCANADAVWLPREGVQVDVDLFRGAVARARRSGDVREYRRAIALYDGELLPDDRYEEWAMTARDELALEHVAVLEELTALLGSRGQLAEAINVARMAVAADPLGEDNSVALMRLLALAGRRTDAMVVFDKLRERLAEELGTEPAVGAQRLVEDIRTRQVIDASLAAREWERVGDLRMLAGDATGAVQAFGSALATVEGSAQGRIERKIADAWLIGHRADEASPHLAAAEARIDAGPELARLLRSRANAAWETGDLDGAQQYAERARAVAEEVGTADDVAAANEALAVVWHMTGAWRHGLTAELDRLTAADDGPAVLARVFDIHHCIGQYHLYGDGLSDSVEDYARRILDRAEQVGAVRAQAFAWCLLGETFLLRARWEEATACLDRSCDLHAGFGSRSGALPWQRRAEAAVSTGDHAAAGAALRRAASIATVSPMAAHVWGRIHATRAFGALESGDPEGAMTAVRAAGTAAARYGDCASCSALLNPVAAEACALVGDRESAHAHADAAGQVAAMFASAAWSAMAETAAAWAAYADGDGDVAHGRFTAAAALYRQARQPYWADRAARASALESVSSR